MKLSDYVKQLQAVVDKHGDIDCVNWIENDDWDSPEEGWYAKTSEEDINSEVNSHVSVACTYISNSGEKAYYSKNLQGYIDCKKETVFVVKDVY